VPYQNFNANYNVIVPYKNIGLNYPSNQPMYKYVNAYEPSNSLKSIGNPGLVSTIGSNECINPQLTFNNVGTTPTNYYDYDNGNTSSNPLSLPTSINKNNERSLKKNDNDQVKKPKKNEKIDEKIDAKIKIMLWGVGKVLKIIDKNVHTVYYYTRKVKNGKINVGIDYGCVLKKFPKVELLEVFVKKDKKGATDEEKPQIKDINKESNMVYVSMKTNGESEKTITLSFKDKKGEKLRISIKLRGSKTKWKNINEMKMIDGYIEKFREDPDDFQNLSIWFGLKEMCETMEIAKTKGIFNKEDIKDIDDAFKNFLKKPEKETHEKFRNFILSKVKTDEKKKELKILCFNSFYKFINNIGNDNNCMINFYKDRKIYIQFLKEYSVVGKSNQNSIIITMDDFEKNGKRKMVPVHNTEDQRRRKKEKKLIKILSCYSDFELTNIISWIFKKLYLRCSYTRKWFKNQTTIILRKPQIIRLYN